MFLGNNNLLKNITQFFIVVVFISISLFMVPFHEHWADEIQAFLIARDADFIEILTTIPYQEGQPVLWHLLLKLCIVFFGSDINISYVSIAVMSVCIGLIVFKYDIPLFYKFLIPFGYYFLYQYNIVARNYCLAYLGLTFVGLTYHNRHKTIWSYTLSLAFLAETTSFFIPVVATLGCFYFYEICTEYKAYYKRYIFPLFCLACIGFSELYQILPINQFSYAFRRYNQLTLIFWLKSFFLSYNKLGSFLFLAILSLYFWKFFCQYKDAALFSYNRNISYFLILIIVFVTTVMLIRPNIHHQGLCFGFFLLCCYLFCQIKFNYIFITLFILHISWSVFSFIYDFGEQTSQQKKVLHFLKERNLYNQTVFPIGYQTLPFQILYPRDKLFIASDLPLYYISSPSEYQARYNFKHLLNIKKEIILVDIVSIAGLQKDVQIEALKNSKKYFLFIFHGALVNKGEQGFLQTLYLFIDRDIYLHSQKNIPVVFYNP